MTDTRAATSAKTVPVHLRVDPRDLIDIEHLAAWMSCSRGEFMRRAVVAYLARMKGEYDAEVYRAHPEDDAEFATRDTGVWDDL